MKWQLRYLHAIWLQLVRHLFAFKKLTDLYGIKSIINKKTANNFSIKCSQIYNHASLAFSKADRKVIFFLKFSKIVMKIVTHLSLNNDSLERLLKYYKISSIHKALKENVLLNRFMHNFW